MIRAMARLSDYKFMLVHNGFVIGSICAGAAEFSAACNDEALFWHGLRAMNARRLSVPFLGHTLPRPRANFVPLIVR